MITQRQKTILDALVREYVASAEPVASDHIVKKCQLPYSSATVRSELQELTAAGYITQPHTSAGRVPTDKGYRFFINNRGAGNAPHIIERETQALCDIRDADDPMDFLKQASRIMAHLTRNFVVAGFPQDDVFYKSGLSELLQEPEFADVALTQSFAALTDTIEEELSRWIESPPHNQPQTFIGAENPIRQARHYGMIISTYETPFEKESVIAVLGPKRMNYAHHINLLERFHDLLDEHAKF